MPIYNAERAHINAWSKSFIGNKHLGFYTDKYSKLIISTMYLMIIKFTYGYVTSLFRMITLTIATLYCNIITNTIKLLKECSIGIIAMDLPEWRHAYSVSSRIATPMYGLQNSIISLTIRK